MDQKQEELNGEHSCSGRMQVFIVVQDLEWFCRIEAIDYL